MFTATKDQTCEFCEKWTAQTWAQYRNRVHNLRSMPEVMTNPCPRCGSTYWARKPPPLDKPTQDVRAWLWWTLVAGAAALILVLALTMLAYGQTTFRDSSGRLTGTATRDANGQTTYRDGAGRQTGTATTNSNGTTIFRDGSGRMTGTAERRR